MAVDPNIKKKANDIRNKIYGKEVRESLASGLEEMSSDVVENEGRQSFVEGRQDSVESQWQVVSDEMTDKDVISAPEIIAARNGEANLKTRIDKDHQEVTAQLAQTSDNLNSRGINVMALPEPYVSAKGDGTTDDTQAFNDAISLLEGKGGQVIIPVGSFRITSKIIIPNGVTIVGSGQRESYAGNTDNRPTQILKDGDFTSFELKSTSVIMDLSLDGMDGNLGNGIQIMGNRGRIENVTISKMGGAGVVIGDKQIRGNRNSWVLRNVSSTNNLGAGFIVDDYDVNTTPPDVNAGLAERANAFGNGGDGWIIGNSAVSTFIQCYSEDNDGYGFRIKDRAQRHLFFNTGSERNTLEDFILEEGSTNNMVFGAMEYTPVDNGTNSIMRNTGGAIQRLYSSNFLQVGSDKRVSFPVDSGLQIVGETPGIQFHDTNSPETEQTLDILYNTGKLLFRTLDDDGTTPQTIITMDRNGKNLESTTFEGKIFATDGLGVGNSVTVNQPTPENVWRKVEVFNADGSSLGYVPVYQDI